MSAKLEILDEAAIADDTARRQPSRAVVEAPDSALERRGPIDLMQVPRLLGSALTDIRTIAEGMAVLPKLLVTLSGITEARGGIDRLEPHLEDVSRVAHPLRRLSERRRPNEGS